MGGRFDLSSAIQTLNPMGAIEQGQRMQANNMTLQDTNMKMERQQQLGDIRQQAVGAEGGYTPQGHMELLMNAGMFEEAQDMDDLLTQRVKNKQDVMEKGFNIMQKTGQLVTQIGAPAWPSFRGSLIAAGVADEESLPVEFDEQAAGIAKNFADKANDTFRMLHFRSGDKQQDILNVGGKVTMGDPYSPGTETAMIKNAKYLASTMGMTEEEAAQIMIQSKDKSDAAVYQDLYKAALRSTYGDQEESAKMAKAGLEAVREYKRQPGQAAPPAAPQAAPGGPNPRATPKGPQQFEEGKVYTDAAGNKAKYVNGAWEPVQ
jgi:hypothetical protein